MWDGNLAGVAAWAPLAKLKLKAEKPLHAGSSDREGFQGSKITLRLHLRMPFVPYDGANFVVVVLVM